MAGYERYLLCAMLAFMRRQVTVCLNHVMCEEHGVKPYADHFVLPLRLLTAARFMTRFGEDDDTSRARVLFRKCSGFFGLKWIETDSNGLTLPEIGGDSNQGVDSFGGVPAFATRRSRLWANMTEDHLPWPKIRA
jgi:hypothetical protein